MHMIVPALLDAQHSPPPSPPLSFVTCRHRDHQPRVFALSGGRTQSRLQRAPTAPPDEPVADLVPEVRAVSRSSARRTQASLISVATGGSACLQLTPRRARRVRGRALLGPHPAGRHAGAQRRGSLFGCRGFGVFTAPRARPLTLSLSSMVTCDSVHIYWFLVTWNVNNNHIYLFYTYKRVDRTKIRSLY